MSIRTITIATASLLLVSISLADNWQRRSDNEVRGGISWTTADRDGNRFGIHFDFDRRGISIGATYEQRDSRYDRYDRNDRYDRRRSVPPVYDYDRYKNDRYDERNFRSREEFSDWREWQRNWDDRDNWYDDRREREWAWNAFNRERDRARKEYERYMLDQDIREMQRDPNFRENQSTVYLRRHAERTGKYPKWLKALEKADRDRWNNGDRRRSPKDKKKGRR